MQNLKFFRIFTACMDGWKQGRDANTQADYPTYVTFIIITMSCITQQVQCSLLVCFTPPCFNIFYGYNLTCSEFLQEIFFYHSRIRNTVANKLKIAPPPNIAVNDAYSRLKDATSYCPCPVLLNKSGFLQ